MDTIYWFEIVGEDSELCGEEFFTQLDDNAPKSRHVEYARMLFPGELIRCIGKVSEEEAEMMGLDTY